MVNVGLILVGVSLLALFLLFVATVHYVPQALQDTELYGETDEHNHSQDRNRNQNHDPDLELESEPEPEPGHPS